MDENGGGCSGGWLLSMCSRDENGCFDGGDG